MARALALAMVLTAVLAAAAPAAAGPSVALSTSNPGNASIATLTVSVKTSGLTAKEKAALKPRLRLSKRNKGVVVLYAYRRLGSKPKFRVVVVGLRGKTDGTSSATAPAMMAQMNMQFLFKSEPPDYTFRGLKSGRNVVASDGQAKITAAAIDAGFTISDDFTVKRAGGRLQDGAPSARTFVNNVFYEATGDTSYAGRDEFLQRMEACCEDE